MTHREICAQYRALYAAHPSKDGWSFVQLIKNVSGLGAKGECVLVNGNPHESSNGWAAVGTTTKKPIMLVLGRDFTWADPC